MCELLRDNLYEFSRYNRESAGEPYFTMPRLRRIAKQCLDALVFTHKLDLIHCDLKPENILIKYAARGGLNRGSLLSADLIPLRITPRCGFDPSADHSSLRI